jgi:hypothetical protein
MFHARNKFFQRDFFGNFFLKLKKTKEKNIKIRKCPKIPKKYPKVFFLNFL